MNTTQQNMSEFMQSSELKKNLFTLILVFGALFLIVETVLTYKKAVNYTNPNNVSYVSVTGKAEEYVKPDTLTFTITVNEEGKNVSEVTAKAAEKTNKAIDILVANGVSKDNIKLESYSVSDKYDTVIQPCAVPMSTGIKTMIAPCQTSSPTIVGQILYQTMTVRIRDIEKNANNDQRSKIISDLSAQNIKADGFTFTVYDMDAAKKAIREKAIEHAKADAKKLAKDLDVRLGKLTSFSDDNNNPYPMMSARPEAMMSKADTFASAPELVTGQQKITSNVTLTYSLK